ncbi:MAG: TraM recognition domain-containing protein [Clostridia bacterium]|nr:TraM recognition domain-containing protein [Clostridia bacterium]
MKLIDKFLKKLNTSRNTFATYILTLISIYITVDRLVEILFMIFTGISYSYWGPIAYTFAMACPLFAYLFSGPSEFATSKSQKVAMFYVSAISIYIIVVSMFTQWINMAAWSLLLSVPNYVEIITDFSDLVRPAFICISLYIPLVTIIPFFNTMYFDIDDSKLHVRSLWDYAGINLSDNISKGGAYTCEMYYCKNYETGKQMVLLEEARYRSLLVCGGSGTGKTAAVFEPAIARDLEKKAFFREAQKEMGFTALKTDIAVLNAPYDNDYLNSNFNLSMLSPAYDKETLFKSYMKKMILGDENSNSYKNLGLTVMSPDYELIDHMINVTNNFGFKYNIIDPQNSDSLGLNPFVYDDPSKIALTISAVLKELYMSSHAGQEVVAYREDITIQAIENIAILLKVIYPKMHEGSLPNLNDMLQLLNNFDLVEKMCEVLVRTPELAEKYPNQISYFKKNFYKNGALTNLTQQNIYAATSQLDNLLRLPGIKAILCNRHNNIDFDKALKNGDITFICTRRGDVGNNSHKAFGLFFLLSMQNAVLRRPGTEKTRTPHFLYIDEFPDFICKSCEAIFTMYRKYRVGTTISAQNLAQLHNTDSNEDFGNHFGRTILANCASKIFTGGSTIEELEWWHKEFGERRTWKLEDTFDGSKLKYDPKHKAKWDFEDYFSPGKLQVLKKNEFAVKLLQSTGKPHVGAGKFSYLNSKYKEKQPIKTFDFAKFASSTDNSDYDENAKKKFDFKHIDFKDDKNEIDPIQTDTTDSKYLFDSEDAVVVNLKRTEKKTDNKVN